MKPLFEKLPYTHIDHMVSYLPSQAIAVFQYYHFMVIMNIG